MLKKSLIDQEITVDKKLDYKSDQYLSLSLLKSKKIEIVNKTPFDDFETNVALKMIDQRITELYDLIAVNHYFTRKTVDGVAELVGENVDEISEQISEEIKALNKKIDLLLPKVKKERQVELLRDPINEKLLPIFLINAGSYCKRKKDLTRAQLRITYTILYHCGLRVGEIRHLTKKDLETAIKAAQFNLVHHKTKKAHIHVLSEKAVEDLRNLTCEFLTIFGKYQYKYLFGKDHPMTDKTLIKLVNKDLKTTCTKFNIPFNIKSHSFRVNMITNLLKVTSVQNTASIIGHSDIRSTMSYNRYTLSKTEIQNLLNQTNKLDCPD